MIDFTTVQTFAPLPELSVLNSKNIALTEQNNVLRNILIVGSIAIVGIYIYIEVRKSSRTNHPIKINYGK